MADRYLDKLVESMLLYLDSRGNGSAQHCNLREHLHYYQGCEECQEAWQKSVVSTRAHYGHNLVEDVHRG